MEPFGLLLAIVTGVFGGVVAGGTVGKIIQCLRGDGSRREAPPRQPEEIQRPFQLINIQIPPRRPPVGPLWQNHRLWEGIYEQAARRGNTRPLYDLIQPRQEVDEPQELEDPFAGGGGGWEYQQGQRRRI